MVIGPAELHGIHVALATPLDHSGQVDEAALSRLVDRVLAGGVHGVCPTGSTGEGPRLTREVRRSITAQVRARVPAGAPVIPGVSALNATDAVAEIDWLAAAGADAVLLAPPSYYPMEPAEVAAYYTDVATSAAVPLVIYNLPQMTKVAVPPPVVGELAGHPQVIGIKDSSRDFEYLQAVIYATDGSDFSVLTGSDTMLLASLTVGAVGAIAASANLVPELSRAVYDAVQKNELSVAADAQRRLFEVIKACRAGITPAGWKTALEIAGVCSAAMVPPALPLDAERREAVARRLRELEIVG